MESSTGGWRRYTLVEPPLLLFIFAQVLADCVVTDFMVFRSCQSILGSAKNECDILHTDSTSDKARSLEAEAQPHATFILMWKSLADGVVPAFLSFFLGSWSDINGRKPLLVAGYIGSALSLLLWSILCNLDIDPWYYLIASVPSALTGGYCGVLLASFSYVTDISSKGARVWHLTMLQAVLMSGTCLGTLLGGEIFKEFGYFMVFSVGCVSASFALIYVLVFVPETIEQRNLQRSWCSLFNIFHVKEMFVICTKKREGFNRVIIWCCICSLSLTILVMVGESSVAYLFASAKFGWDVNTYTTYQAVCVFVGIIGTFLGAKLFRTYFDPNLSDMGIAIFAVSSSFAGAITKAFTSKYWHLYLANILSMFGGLAAPVLRAALSNAALPQDIGKVYSLTTSMEAVIPLAASPIYMLVYTRSMPPIFPAPVYLVSAMTFTAIIIIVIKIDKEIFRTGHSRYIAINQEID